MDDVGYNSGLGGSVTPLLSGGLQEAVDFGTTIPMNGASETAHRSIALFEEKGFREPKPTTTSVALGGRNSNDRVVKLNDVRIISEY